MGEPIRVLNLFTIMNRGGAETMVMNYYRNIDRTKIQFDFLLHRSEKGAYDDEIRKLGGRIYYAMPIYPQNFHAYKKFIKGFFNEHKEYNIIHSHMSELGYFAFKEATKHKVETIICHAHNAAIGFDLKMIVRNYFKWRMKPYITHQFACGVNAGKWLFGNDNSTIMKNAIDTSKFIFDTETRNKFRKEYNLQNKFVVGNVARFNEQKNHVFLIDIFAEIHKKNENTVLMLVGDGELRKEIEDKVEKLGLTNNVIFTGVKSNINELLMAMDVFLFPSLFEGLGIVLIEAQATGMKCFTSKDVVPIEAKLTDLVEYIPLKKSDEYWAEKVLVNINSERKNMQSQIEKAGYDIKTTAKWLENFYLENWSNNG